MINVLVIRVASPHVLLANKWVLPGICKLCICRLCICMLWLMVSLVAKPRTDLVEDCSVRGLGASAGISVVAVAQFVFLDLLAT